MKIHKIMESMGMNMLGVNITRPDQVLIVMRGIPGAGKSTEAKRLVGDGIIHSTDDVIESQYDYREFFEKMISTKDFGMLGRMHGQNLANAKKSMLSGISPVIIDNTNIKGWESKNYVKFALENGYDENNIVIADVGYAGLSAQELADRNTHGVPVDKIEQMIQAYKSIGKLTVFKIMKGKNPFERKKEVLYNAVILDEVSHNTLVSKLKDMIPNGWEIYAHHMTISFGKELGDDLKKDLGVVVNLKVNKVGINDMVMAVEVSGYYSDNAVPHVTVAVNTTDGGKPFMSNKINDWDNIQPFNISGVVTEVIK